MKRSFFHSRLSKLSSFTLVELLVVIGIIAILAAVLLPAANKAIQSAKRAKANSMANQIQTSVLAYYTEYGVYPVPSTVTSGSDAYFSTNDTTDWQNLTWALCGNVNLSSPTTTVTPTVSNSRSIAFLSMKASDLNTTNGVPLNPITPDTVNGPYFNIAINSSYSGILGTNAPSNIMPNFAANTTAAGGTSSSGVAVWANCNPYTSSTNINWWVHTY